MQSRHSSGHAPLHVRPDVGAQKRLHAVHLSSCARRGDHGRFAFQTVEQFARVLSPGELRCELRRKHLADADCAEEVADLGFEAREDLTDEVLGDRALVAGEGGEGGSRVGRIPQGDRGEPQRRSPSFRQPVQCRDLRIVEGGACRVEKCLGLVPRESQLIDPNFVQPALEPKPGQRQGWVEPAGQDKPQSARTVPNEDAQRVQGVGRQQRVDVVKNQPDRLGEVVQGIHDLARELGNRRGECGQEPAHSAVVGHGGGHRHGAHDIEQQPQRVVVVVVERQPRGTRHAVNDPFRQQGRLAVSRWCAHQDERLFGSTIQFVEQPRSRHEADRRSGKRCLCGRSVHRHPPPDRPKLPAETTTGPRSAEA